MAQYCISYFCNTTTCMSVKIKMIFWRLKSDSEKIRHWQVNWLSLTFWCLSLDSTFVGCSVRKKKVNCSRKLHTNNYLLATCNQRAISVLLPNQDDINHHLSDANNRKQEKLNPLPPSLNEDICYTTRLKKRKYILRFYSCSAHINCR